MSTPCPPLRLLVSLLVLAVAPLTPDLAAAPRKADPKAKVQALRQRLKALKSQKAAARAELRQTKRAQVRISDQLNASYQRLESANEALQRSARRLRLAEQEVARATRRLAAAEARLKEHQSRFGRRIAVSYMEGPVTSLDVLLGARDVSDFLDRQYYLSRIAQHDAELLRGLRLAQQEVARERRLLLEQKAALASAHEENAEHVAAVAREASAREKLLEAVRRERAVQEQELEALEEDSAEVQRLLEREIARRLANPRSFRALPRWSGSFVKPTSGAIGSRFGYRMHPILRYRRMHNGLDIGGRPGQPVWAAAEGEVLFASWRGGYGQCIILLHGGGMSTLYGHLSRILVRPGQRVRRGQVIGSVGSTGLSTAPHLHWEVRRNGVPVNPL